MLVYNKKYIKAKVREFNGVIKTNFLRDEIPRKGVHYAFMAFITINSIMRMKKKNYPQVYLEECEYKIHWTRARVGVRIWHWIRVEVGVRIWLWIIVFFSLIVMLCFKKCIDGCFLNF